MKHLERKGVVIQDIERRFKDSIENLLHKLYIVDMLSAEDVAKRLGTSHVTINKLLIRMGIKKRFNWQEVVKSARKR
ncbi:MAG: hypothetical protein RR252_07875 [Longicatena sp.]